MLLEDPLFAREPQPALGRSAPPSADPLSVLQEMLARGDPRDLSNSQLAPVRRYFERTDGRGLWAFAFFICGLTKLTPTLHFEMCAFLSRWGEPGWRRLMMMVPRGTFKTSLGSKALPLWLATRDPEVTVGIFNAAQDQAKGWISSIRQILEGSTLYHMLWPERLPPGVHFREREAGRSVPRSWKWGDAGIHLQRRSLADSEFTFAPFGIGGSSTGRHFSHRVMDDLIGETSIGSPAMIEDAISFVDHARALERPAHGGCELINCTPWAYRDVYSHVLQKWPLDYQVYRRSLLEDPETGEPDVVTGESIFPQEITTAQAREMYARDPFVFSSQFQCIPQAGRETSFDRTWVHPFRVVGATEDEPELVIPRDHYDPERVHSDVAGERAPNRVPLHWCDRAVLLDPAPSKKAEKGSEPRARNGIVAVALDPWGRLFTLEALPLREDPLTVMEAVVEIALRWRCDKVGIEEVNFSAVYGPLWTAILRHRNPGLHLAFAPLRPKGVDKDQRIRALVGLHREGLWFYNPDTTGYAVQELLEYPNSETRDLLDAQAYWQQLLSRPATPDERSGAYWSGEDRGRSQWTGY